MSQRKRVASFDSILSAEYQTFVTAAQAGWRHQHADVPHLLYHYTTGEGLVGIVGSRSLWMTNVRYMNDLSELQYASGVIAESYDEIRKQCETDVLNEVFRRSENSLNPFDHGRNVYCASFCENGNLLSQWRAYGDRGGGYAVAMDLFKALPYLSIQCVLRKVIYDAEVQRNAVRSMLHAYCEFVSEHTAGLTVREADDQQILPRLCSLLPEALWEYLICFKHPEFREEQEWRLVTIGPASMSARHHGPAVNYRSFRGNIVPYVSLNFDNHISASRDEHRGVGFYIAEITIGPTLSPDMNEESVRSLLRDLNRDHYPRVVQSGIPLRWL